MSNNPAPEQGSPELRDPMEMYEDRESGSEVMPAEAAKQVEAEMAREDHHVQLVRHSYEASLQHQNADLNTLAEGEQVLGEFMMQAEAIGKEGRAEVDTVLAEEPKEAPVAAKEAVVEAQVQPEEREVRVVQERPAAELEAESISAALKEGAAYRGESISSRLSSLIVEQQLSDKLLDRLDHIETMYASGRIGDDERRMQLEGVARVVSEKISGSVPEAVAAAEPEAAAAEEAEVKTEKVEPLVKVKIYETPQEDPLVRAVIDRAMERATEAVAALREEDKKNGTRRSQAEYGNEWDKALAGVQGEEWSRFIDEHPEQAFAYMDSLKPLQAAQEANRQVRQERAAQREKNAIPNETAAFEARNHGLNLALPAELARVSPEERREMMERIEAFLDLFRTGLGPRVAADFTYAFRQGGDPSGVDNGTVNVNLEEDPSEVGAGLLRAMMVDSAARRAQQRAAAKEAGEPMQRPAGAAIAREGQRSENGGVRINLAAERETTPAEEVAEFEDPIQERNRHIRAERKRYLDDREAMGKLFMKAVDRQQAERFIVWAENRTKLAKSSEDVKKNTAEFANKLHFTEEESKLLQRMMLSRFAYLQDMRGLRDDQLGKRKQELEEGLFEKRGQGPISPQEREDVDRQLERYDKGQLLDQIVVEGRRMGQVLERSEWSHPVRVWFDSIRPSVLRFGARISESMWRAAPPEDLPVAAEPETETAIAA